MNTKMKRILFLAVLSVSVSSVAVEIPEFLRGTWVQSSRDHEIDVITFSVDFDSNVKIVVDHSRQVGLDGTEIPYPTVCRYRYTGIVTQFGPPEQHVADHYRSTGREVPNYYFNYSVTKVELLPALFNSEHCRKFIQEQERDIAAGTLSYSEAINDLNDSVIKVGSRTIMNKQ